MVWYAHLFGMQVQLTTKKHILSRIHCLIFLMFVNHYWDRNIRSLRIKYTFYKNYKLKSLSNSGNNSPLPKVSITKQTL